MIEEEFKPFFPVEEVPRVSMKNPQASLLISQEKPVVIIDAHLCDSARKWCMEYLQDHFGCEKNMVYSSDTKIFKYYDDTKITNFCPDFVRPVEKIEMTFKTFSEHFRHWKPGDKKLYLQQRLTSNVDSSMTADFAMFNWRWLTAQQKANAWGPLTSNLLLVGMAGNITPVHFDEQQNIFCQLIGYKRFILFAPDHHDRLYPHPVYHPHDRQSQVDLLHPDFERFPGLRQLKGYSCVLGPGEALYIPIYWWHHVESLYTTPYTVSLNFWYKGSTDDTVSCPLLGRQVVAISRNIEKMVVDVLRYPKHVDSFFQSLALGRYTEPCATLDPRLSSSIALRDNTLQGDGELRSPNFLPTNEDDSLKVLVGNTYIPRIGSSRSNSENNCSLSANEDSSAESSRCASPECSCSKQPTDKTRLPKVSSNARRRRRRRKQKEEKIKSKRV